LCWCEFKKNYEKSTFKYDERDKTLALLQIIEKKRHSDKNDHLLNRKMCGITGKPHPKNGRRARRAELKGRNRQQNKSRRKSLI